MKKSIIYTSTTDNQADDSVQDEVDRIRAAVDAHLQLKQSRDRLKQQMGLTEASSSLARPSPAGKTRVSPIHEEETSSQSLDSALDSGSRALSTESGNTIRGFPTPGASVGTPSYPFPQMKPPRPLSYRDHRPFTALSPTAIPSTPYSLSSHEGPPRDQVISEANTPLTATSFRPPGPHHAPDEQGFPSPNLYELSLMLTAEPGLDSWWTTVSKTMRDLYKAERVTLSIPADSTDIENVPWGQKATFNVQEEDLFSLAYIGQATSQRHSSGETNNTSISGDVEDQSQIQAPSLAMRPKIQRGHSFAAFEDTKRPTHVSADTTPVAPSRPSALTRSKSYVVGQHGQSPRMGTLQNAELQLESMQERIDSAEETAPPSWENIETTPREVRGRVFPVLQALDYEADPLLDSSGVLRVLDRGRLVALTRDYPYVENDEAAGEGRPSRNSTTGRDLDKGDKSRPEFGSRMSSFVSGSSAKRSSKSVRSHPSDKGKAIPASRQPNEEFPLASKYEEYEQVPPSPWSQSPAPSPAVRMETAENPFFANMTAVDASFNPDMSIPDYSQTQSVEAIGVDQSWTVLHVPLFHPLLSRPVQSFRLDTAAMESKTGRRKDSVHLPSIPDSGRAVPAEQPSMKRDPIAILSILSPVIPYVSSLRHSLQALAPHLATSFSICRNYTNLETELAGLSRKRPQTVGFGAIAATAAGDDPMYTNYAPHQSIGGSMTSPSDYSGLSRSAHASPAVTPGWESSSQLASAGLGISRRPADQSPSFAAGESYFITKTKAGLSRIETPGGRQVGTRRPSKDSSSASSKSQHSSVPDDHAKPKESDSAQTNPPRTDIDEAVSKARDAQVAQDAAGDDGSSLDSSPAQSFHDAASHVGRQQLRSQGTPSGTHDKPHTLLHSYGADFGTTFQSLPATSLPSRKLTATKAHARSASNPRDMPPPSDRLKGLMLESLPVQVFVALPQTGEIVWVNNRFLTYRGQTVSDLFEDPWGSLHPEEKQGYLRAWTHAIKTGEPFSMQVRIKRFDGNYRWFFTRAVGSKDSRGVIVQWYGSYMDIHDQHIAEVKAARQEEIEASEAKHKQLANLIPQIIFSATEDEGVTFANEQWLSYTGQSFEDALGLGFMDYIHPEDLAMCHIPFGAQATNRPAAKRERTQDSSNTSSQSSSKVSLASDNE